MASKNENGDHPGRFVRDNVIPKGVSVKKAAETIGVGRPALSNFLNGNAALSPEMAAKFEKAFGADAKELIKLQSAYNARQVNEAEIASSTRAFVPPFLQAKANDIEDWADQLSSRAKLSVLLRTLVHSTCDGLSLVDFPGNDDAERPGWDGKIETSEGNPWVPAGLSGWEYGTTKDVMAKANKDYKKSITAVSKAERQNMTFVFVTPRRWPRKNKWRDERQAEGKWKTIVVFDSSDLEQWMQQSIPAQVWYANERGQNFQGTQSLDRSWIQWNADCEPPFTTKIFDQAAITSGKKLIDRLQNSPDRIVRIAADSKQEGLAFLYCILTEGDEGIRRFKDRIVVFKETGPLTKLATKSATFIPVITDREIEQELSQTGSTLGGIVIAPRTMAQSGADIKLDTLSTQAFEDALSSMGLGRDEIDRLSNESGKSLTVLRRRLTQNPALRSPDWSTDETMARALFPFMLAGAWKADKEADKIILCHLAGSDDYEQLEEIFSRLLLIDSAPVWSIGNFRGIVSKIDALYAVHQFITPIQIKRFIEAAELVLSERDPSLDLPEDDRWAANIYGKTREISAALRDGLADSMVLLAIHGRKLFHARIGVDPESMATMTIRQLFDPMTADTLESQSSDLPLYAEAAPNEFLSIIERDIASDSPHTSVLMRPVPGGMFGSNPRTGLLWALEALAWSPIFVSRVVNILAHLAEIEADDNWGNKPSNTLLSIFRSWMPQTGAPLKKRIALFDDLVEQHPKVAWVIAVSQHTGFQLGDYSNKPKWRDYAFGYGAPISRVESREFIDHCVKALISWKKHDRETLGDLVRNISGLQAEDQSRIWDIISKWSKTAKDEDRAWLREQIRTSTNRTVRRKATTDQSQLQLNDQVQDAMECYNILEPNDIVWKHAWLFKNTWVEESWDEIQSADLDFAARSERIAKKRYKTVREVFSSGGYEAIMRLAFSGSAAHLVGNGMAECLPNEDEQLSFVRAVLADENMLGSQQHQLVLDGFFFRLGDVSALALIDVLWSEFDVDTGIKLLCLCRFGNNVWQKIEALGEDVSQLYWTTVSASWNRQSEEELQYAVSKLLEVQRAITALNLVHLDLKNIESEQLYQILKELPHCKEDTRRIGQIDQYIIRDALKLLNEREAFALDRMAQLEFLYLELFRYDKGEIPNLEKEISRNPSIFCEAIIYAYKPDSHNDDQELTEEQKALAKNAFTLLDVLSQIPGRKDDGVIDEQSLEDWIIKAQTICDDQGRRSSCDHQIGQLLSGAPVGEDNIWPCEPVRTVMDRVLNERMSEGFQIGRYNSRGVVLRGEGGAQERELAQQYEGWAKACDFDHPRVADALREIAVSYANEAEWHDNEAVVRKRLRY